MVTNHCYTKLQISTNFLLLFHNISLHIIVFQQAKATHKLKTVKKIRAVRSGITTRVNKTGAEFWSSLPSDLLRRTAYNADVVRAASE